MTDASFDRAAASFLDLFERVRAAADTSGRPIEEYKPTERECLRIVFAWLFQTEQTGLRFLATLVHELVWAQCLGNANHRTTTLLAQILVEEVEPSLREDAKFAEKFAGAFDGFAGRSKRLLSKRGDIGYGAGGIKKHHAELCHRFVVDLWADQSRHWETIGAQRLMDLVAPGGHSREDLQSAS